MKLPAIIITLCLIESESAVMKPGVISPLNVV